MCVGEGFALFFNSSLYLMFCLKSAPFLYVSFSRSLSVDNGFIPESLLEDVMKALDLVSEPE